MIHFTIEPIDGSYTVKRKTGTTYRVERKLICGYYSGFRRNVRSKRQRRYLQWKKHVQTTFEDKLERKCPLIVPTERCWVCTVTYYEKEHRFNADPENVRKGILDVLAYKEGGGGDDFQVGGWHDLPRLDPDWPRVECWIFREDEGGVMIDLIDMYVQNDGPTDEDSVFLAEGEVRFT